jgi:hypothetical protein
MMNSGGTSVILEEVFGLEGQGLIKLLLKGSLP